MDFVSVVGDLIVEHAGVQLPEVRGIGGFMHGYVPEQYRDGPLVFMLQSEPLIPPDPSKERQLWIGLYVEQKEVDLDFNFYFIDVEAGIGDPGDAEVDLREDDGIFCFKIGDALVASLLLARSWLDCSVSTSDYLAVLRSLVRDPALLSR